MSTVSVIIPCYNREDLIGETISNLLAQSRPPDEIIAVDDGSTDKTMKILRSFGSKVKVLEQGNAGPGAARNAGLRVATGTLIQFQDSDDLFSLNKLEIQEKLMEATMADIVMSPWVKAWIKGPKLYPENHVLQQTLPAGSVTLSNLWLRGWSTVFQSLLFRRSFLDRAGHYRIDLRLGEDGELFFRALLLNPRIAFTDEALMIYRLHRGNKLTEDAGASQRNRIEDWVRCLRCALDLLRDRVITPDRVTRLLLMRELWRQHALLKKDPDANPELKRFLAVNLSGVPTAMVGLVDMAVRAQERFRQVTRGARWMPAYQSGPLTRQQQSLIKTLGMNIETGRYPW